MPRHGAQDDMHMSPADLSNCPPARQPGRSKQGHDTAPDFNAGLKEPIGCMQLLLLKQGMFGVNQELRGWPASGDMAL